MGMRRDARKHDTTAVRRLAVVSQDYAEHQQGDRVMTIDGPGRVIAVNDGPYPGSEEYEIRLEGGLGGGTYDAGQITASVPVEASVGTAEATGVHLASDDYPELGSLLHDRPDPASLRYTAELASGGTPVSTHTSPAADGGLGDGDEGQVAWNPGEYNESQFHRGDDWRLARSINGEEIDQHGSAPGWHRAANPNEYDRQSTEGEPDPDWIEDIREKQQAMASHPDDAPGDDGDEEDPHGDDFDERGLCAYPHEGPCPTYDHGDDSHHEGSLHVAMPSRRYPDHPEGFDSEITGSEYENYLRGRIDGDTLGGIDYTAYDKHGRPMDASKNPEGVHALKVNMLHTDAGSGRGLASAMMDHLYTKHPNAWINHGYRTHAGLRWWNSYDEPAGHENRNIHNVEPHHWSHIFDPYSVAGDIRQNEANDPGHHSDHHDVDWATEGDHYRDEDDEEYCSTCGEYGHHDKDEYYHPKEEDEEDEEPPTHDPDPRKTELHHGFAVHLNPDDHKYVHDSSIPAEARASRLLDVVGRGNMSPHRWFKGSFRGDADASTVAENLPRAGAQTPATKVTLHAHPFQHDEVHQEEDDGEEPKFETDASRGAVHFKNTDSPINFHLKGMAWSEYGKPGSDSKHTFDKPEPVGMPLAQYHPSSVRDNTHDTPWDQVERRQTRQEHEQRYAPRQNPLNPPGTGEQMKLFSSLPSLKTAHAVDPIHPDNEDDLARHLIEEHGHDPEHIAEVGQIHRGLGGQHEMDHDEYEGLHPDDFLLPHHHAPTESTQSHMRDFEPIRNLEHPLWGGGFNPEPGAAEHAVLNSEPAVGEVPTHPSAFSMLITAAMDPSFRFHVTAGWRDVQAKAKRIRANGGVQITHADEGTVFGNVRGDHNVYETGLQRVVGKRQSVATYTCGCKWGAYHWGASDDMSRFAGRMCSHALALQYEAASRGMFGRDVEADDAKPRWVPSKVVVKYDIDTGQHIRATASVPEHSPLMAALAFMHEGDPAGRVVLAAVNDMFGDTSGYNEPSLMNPAGPTVPWNKDESPASAGNLSGGEPHNWGSITGPTMLPRIASVITTEAFWQAIVPLVRAIAPKVIKSVAPAMMGHEVKKHQPGPVQEAEQGAQAILHDEPEGALPETDGDDHTASLGDVDIASGHDVYALDDDALSPENPSMQTQGSTADIVADFQRSAAARTLMDGGPKGGKSNSDIAQAAEAYLAKTAASSFTRAEQDALIHESPGTQASNTDRLDIAGTHYAELEQMDETGDDALWLM